MNPTIAKEQKPLSSIIDQEAGLKDQLIADIILLGIRAQYHTKRCVFIEFSGHVNTLRISIGASKDDYAIELTSTYIRLSPFSFYGPKEKERFNQELIEKLEQTKQYLTNFIENEELESDSLPSIETCTA